jgi:hypothetical protein
MLAGVSVGNSRASAQQLPKPNSTNDRPVIEVDLHKFADARWDPNHNDKAGSTLLSKISFADSNSLIWAWVTRDNNLALDRGNVPPPAPTGRVHAVLLDAATGAEKAKRLWLAPVAGAAQFVIGDGRFLLCLDKKMQLFSSQFELSTERDLHGPEDCSRVRNLRASISSSEKKLFLFSLSEGLGSQAVALDIDTLEIRSTSSGNLTDISDHWQIGFCGEPRQVCVRQAGGVWEVLESPVASEKNSGFEHRSALFVSDDTILIRNDREMEVMKVDGSILFQRKLPQNRSYGRFVFGEAGLASGGERFAIMESRMRGINSGFLDESKQPSDDQIVVYSVSERRAIFALKVKGDSVWPPFVQHTNEFALSPDGNRLAAVSDGILKIYKLPASSTAH